MAMTKQAHDEALKKIAEIDARDATNAFELGFLKLAQDLGLDEAEYEEFRKEALALQDAENKTKA